MSEYNKMIAHHAAASTLKTTAGGGAVAAVSYVGTQKIIEALPEPSLVAQATEIATLVAAICTAIYFLGMAVRTWIGIYKDVRK